MAQTPPCSLTDQALEQRMHKWGSLHRAWLGSERTATGAIVRYRLDQWVAQTLLELLEAEGRCCPTLSFEATVTVRIEAPESMRAWVASTFAHDTQPVAPDADQPGVDVAAVREAVRVHYAAAARRAAGAEPGQPREPDVTGVGANAYGPGELEGLPEHAVGSSIGCANPVAVADLRPGDIVVDLGSGGGTDVLLSARRVGPTGRAYGLDMTDEMLDRRARAERGRRPTWASAYMGSRCSTVGSLTVPHKGGALFRQKGAEYRRVGGHCGAYLCAGGSETPLARYSPRAE